MGVMGAQADVTPSSRPSRYCPLAWALSANPVMHFSLLTHPIVAGERGNTSGSDRLSLGGGVVRSVCESGEPERISLDEQSSGSRIAIAGGEHRHVEYSHIEGLSADLPRLFSEDRQQCASGAEDQVPVGRENLFPTDFTSVEVWTTRRLITVYILAVVESNCSSSFGDRPSFWKAVRNSALLWDMIPSCHRVPETDF